MVVTLRSRGLPDGRVASLEAGPLDGTRFEAWLSCTGAAPFGAGTTSPCIRTAVSVDELQEWAAGMTESDFEALVAKHCP
jgi:hypothetical protein